MAQDPNFIRLRSDSLYEKYGFEDGDILSNHPALEDYFYPDVTLNHITSDQESALLLLVVERFLVPELEKHHHAIEVTTGWNKAHNGVRLDGIDNWLSGHCEATPELVPEYVDVPVEGVKRICEAVLGKL